MFNLETNTLLFIGKLLGTLSIATFALSLLCIPWIVSLLPSDFFSSPDQPEKKATYSEFTLPLLLVRNILGLLLLLSGIGMLFLPGQGVITIVIAIGIMSFPYKQRLLFNLTRPTSVQQSLNWLRKKTRKAHFNW